MFEGEKAKNALLGYVTLNINDELRKYNSKIIQSMPEEIDGWFTIKLWKLMQIYGKHIGIGFNLMFETTMRIKA